MLKLVWQALFGSKPRVLLVASRKLLTDEQKEKVRASIAAQMLPEKVTVVVLDADMELGQL